MTDYNDYTNDPLDTLNDTPQGGRGGGTMQDPLDLASYEEAFQQGVAEAPPPPQFGPIPEGVYPVEVVSAMLQATKSTGRPMLALQMKITNGQNANRRIFKNHVIDNSTPEAVKRLGFLYQDLTALGFPIKKLHELNGVTAQLVGIQTTVRIQHQTDKVTGQPRLDNRGEVQYNVYFQGGRNPAPAVAQAPTQRGQETARKLL